jgi:hypothetical protein
MKLCGPIVTVMATVILTILSPLRILAAAQTRGQTLIKVSVISLAELSPQTVKQAEQEAGRVFRSAGIEIVWLNCRIGGQDGDQGSCGESSFPSNLHLSILPNSKNLPRSVVGLAFLGKQGQGCYADLFDEALRRLQNETDVSTAVILGHAMAHEMGHLLLGTNSHSPKGLMRAHWDRADLSAAMKGNLSFSDEQSVRLHRHLDYPVKENLRSTANMLALPSGSR